MDWTRSFGTLVLKEQAPLIRIGQRPQQLVTTTPKPIKLLKQLIARNGDDVVVTRGSNRQIFKRI